MKTIVYLPLIYLWIYLAMPLLGYFYWGDEFFSAYKPDNDPGMLMLASLFTCFYFFLASFFGLLIRPVYLGTLSFIYKLPVISLCVVSYFFLALNFYGEYGSTFRHHGGGMLNSGPLVFALYILKVYCFFAIFVLRMYKRMVSRVFILVIGISGLFSFMTSLDIIHVVVCFILFIKPELEEAPGKNSITVIFKLLMAGLLVLFGGLVTKTGFDISGYLDLVDNLLMFFVSRFSVHILSLANIMNDLGFWVPKSLDAVFFELQRIVYRMLSLMGFAQTPLEPNNLARINAVEIFYDPRDITGASPGPAALALLTQPLIVGLIFRAFIDGLCLAYIGNILKDFRLGLIALSFFPIYLSLMDTNLLLINPLQPGAVIFIFLVISGSKIEQMRRL